MKFILLNLNDNKENVILKRNNIDDEHQVRELLFSKDHMVNALKNKPNFFGNIKKRLYERKLKSIIIKALELKNRRPEEWYYIYSQEFAKNAECLKYILNIIKPMGGLKYVPLNEMNSNLSKYVKEYLEKNKLNAYESKMLVVYKDIKNINFNMISESIKEYKVVNIYLAEKPSTLVLEKIAKINKEEGCSIEVVKYSKKAFLQYDVIFFADDLRTNYPRMKIEKRTLVIDEQVSKCDKYNSNIIFFNNLKGKINEINVLKEKYDLLELAGMIRKIVN